MIAYTWFTILENYGDAATYQCNNCGEIFDSDAYTLNNTYYDIDWLDYILICPTCGQKGEY